MKGCTLFGRFVFNTDEKNISRRLKEKKNKEPFPENPSAEQGSSDSKGEFT
jgi:hypothetical protein